MTQIDESYALEKHDIKINDTTYNYSSSFSNGEQCEYTLSNYSRATKLIRKYCNIVR